MPTFFKPYNLEKILFQIRKLVFLNSYFTVGFGFPYAEHVKFIVELKIASIFVISFSIRGETKI